MDSKSIVRTATVSGLLWQILKETPLGVSGLVPANSSYSLGSGLVATHGFTGRHVDDRVSVILFRILSGLADDLVLPNPRHVWPSDSS